MISRSNALKTDIIFLTYNNAGLVKIKEIKTYWMF